MVDTKGRRAKNRRKFARNVKRTLKNVLLIPGKIPPITEGMVEISMRICEVFGVLFVGTLVANLASDNPTIAIINIVMGLLFFGLMAFIKLADYQDRLIREQLSNYIYIR